MDQYKVFVGGIPWSIDSEELRGIFAQCGEVTECVVIKDRDTGKSKGFGFVSFSGAEAVKQALALDGTDVEGKKINVKPAKPREQKSFGGDNRFGSRNDFRRDKRRF